MQGLGFRVTMHLHPRCCAESPAKLPKEAWVISVSVLQAAACKCDAEVNAVDRCDQHELNRAQNPFQHLYRDHDLEGMSDGCGPPRTAPHNLELLYECGVRARLARLLPYTHCHTLPAP